MSDWLAGEFVADEVAALLVSANGDGGAAMAASLFCVPAGPDCMVFDSRLWAVGIVIGCGCEELVVLVAMEELSRKGCQLVWAWGSSLGEERALVSPWV